MGPEVGLGREVEPQRPFADGVHINHPCYGLDFSTGELVSYLPDFREHPGQPVTYGPAPRWREGQR